MLANSPFNDSVSVFEVGFRRTLAMRLLLLRGIFFVCVVLPWCKMMKRERKYMLVKLCFHRWYASTVDIRECRRHQKRVFLTWLLEYKFSKEVLLLSVICRRGCAKFIGMATFSVFAGEPLDWMHEVVSISVGVRYERCKCGLARRYCIHLSAIYKVPRSHKDMHRVCLEDVLAEEDILQWRKDFCSSRRIAWHDSLCVESRD